MRVVSLNTFICSYSTCFSPSWISFLQPVLVMWVLGTCLVVMVLSAEAMKVLRVVVITLDLVKPPRPLGRTELMANGFKLEVSFPIQWYLHREDSRRTRNDVVLKWKSPDIP